MENVTVSLNDIKEAKIVKIRAQMAIANRKYKATEKGKLKVKQNWKDYYETNRDEIKRKRDLTSLLKKREKNGD